MKDELKTLSTSATNKAEVVQETLDPLDLRSPRSVGRPSVRERSQPSAIKELAQELTADILFNLKKNVKNLDPSTQTNLLGKLLPLIVNDQTQTKEDVTMEMLCKKALSVSVRIKQANKIVEDKG